MSLFSNAQPAGQTLGQAGAQTASPFGKTAPQTPTLSLFNTTATQQNTAPSLFGQPQQQQQQQQQQQGAGLFGNPQRKTSIFGGSLNVPPTSLFGSQQQLQPQQQQGANLFGGSTQQRPSLSLFGASNQQPQQLQQPSQSLFGGQPTSTSGQQQLGSSLFGNLGQQTAAQSQTSMFGTSQPQQQQMGSSIFGTSLAAAPVARELHEQRSTLD
jgi:Nucleoporin FG repeat region